jgi:hypothetical protein
VKRPRRTLSGTAWPAAALLALVGCSGAPEPHEATPRAASHGPVVPPLPLPIDAARTVIHAPGVTGLSDLTVDDAGHLWSISEKYRALVRMAPDGGGGEVIPLVGVPDGLDVEGAAWLGGDRIALATEADDPDRQADLLLFARVTGRRVVVEREAKLEYSLWPLRPRGNQGIEGLCHAGGSLVAAVESVIGGGDRRLAPIAVYDLASGTWTPSLVRLTSATGKISALSCRLRGDGAAAWIDVMAVERHFEVARLIRFELPVGRAKPGPPRVVAPVLVTDLAPLLVREENFEGLVWDGDRSFALVVDNDWAVVSGPNLLVRARLSGPAPSPPLAGGRRPASRPRSPRPRATPARPAAPPAAASDPGS